MSDRTIRAFPFASTLSPSLLLPAPRRKAIRATALAVALALLPVGPTAVLAAPVDEETAATPDIENSKYQFEGEINSGSVYVRSGPSDNDYATAKLDKGARITVVGHRFEWLKVLPPEGSFCYVAKAYVERHSDGKAGRVTNTLNVRVGSNLLPMKTKVASKLETGTLVQIIGEQDEYFKIAPPAGVYLYVNSRFVDPLRRVAIPETPGVTPDQSPTNPGPSAPSPTDAIKPQSTTGGDGQPTAAEPTGGEQATPTQATQSQETSSQETRSQETAPAPTGGEFAEKTQTGGETNSGGEVKPGESTPTGGETAVPPVTGGEAKTGGELGGEHVGDSTAPAGGGLGGETGGDTVAVTPATQPSAPVLQEPADLRFDRLESAMREASVQPIEQQPVPELLAGYQSLLADESLPESMRRIAEQRVQTLTVHNDNRQIILDHRQKQIEQASRLKSLKEEQNEINDRLKQGGIAFYTAVGTLRPSSLQVGPQTLYRLTDPSTGRTLVYLRSDDTQLESMVGKFIGVSGDVVDDAQLKLKWISPTEAVLVDSTRVNRSIAARILPPSMLPGAAMAGTATDEVNR